MEPITVAPDLVAACGLYCAACKRLRKGKCPGCAGNHKANWCKVRTCVQEHGWATCAECSDHPDPATCAKFDGWLARVFGVLFNSDRRACVLRIRAVGRDVYAAEMTERGLQSIPRR